MKHPVHTAFLENKTMDQYNFGSDLSLKCNTSHSETTLFINEFSKLSQNKQNNCGNRGGRFSPKIVNTSTSSNFVTTLPEISRKSTHGKMDMLLNIPDQKGVGTFTSQKNNSLTTVNIHSYNPRSQSFTSSRTLQNTDSRSHLPILNTSGPSSSLRANLRKNTHHNGQVHSQDVRSYPDVFKATPKNDQKKKTEAINVQPRPRNYNTVELENSSQSSNLFSAEASTFTLEGVDRIEVVPKLQIEAWNQFQSHINMIDDVTSITTQHFIKPFRSSSVFQSVLADMYGNCDNGKPQSCTKLNSHTVNIAIYATKFLGKVRALHKFKSSPNGILVNGRRLEKSSQSSNNNVKNSEKGWGLLRQCVNELKAQERMRQDSEFRDVPGQSLMGLSDLERARRDLYERYGVVPTRRNDGTVTQENTMLSERARNVLESCDQRSTKSRKYNSLNEFASFRHPVHSL